MSQTDLQGRYDCDEPPGNDDTWGSAHSISNLVVHSYEGEKSNGEFDGEGVAYFEGGHVYKGMFSKGLIHGTGVFIQVDGLKYEGEFVNNIPLGNGTYNWPDGSSYTGEVYNGIRHGMGTIQCAKNGMSYEGQWRHGKRHGQGTAYYDEEKTSWYKGDWVNNNREGLGERCYPSGNIYFGEWKNNLRHGEGTMKWLQLGQQYDGEWQDGIQHGKGTNVWILMRVDGSQYPLRNQYSGHFKHGQRDGEGTFMYAGGTKYKGDWKEDKKHGQGKFTAMDGRVFEGEFVNDKMMKSYYNERRVPSPPSALPLSDTDSDAPGHGVTLNIEWLLNKFPEDTRDSERHQVEFVVLRQDAQLRSIYSFYSRLGHTHSPDNTFQLTRMQLWRLFKDCHIHHHGVTLAQLDRLIKGDDCSEDIHSPYTPMLLRHLLSGLIVVAHHIYSKDMNSEKNILAACLTKLMTDNILPNAKNVKGILFSKPGFAVVMKKYVEQCWEIFQTHCRISTAVKDGCTMTNRHLLWMFQDFHLLDDQLTILKLLEIINTESSDSTYWSSCLNLEMTFLEFLEVLLGCAEVMSLQVSLDLEEAQSLSEFDSVIRITFSCPVITETMIWSTENSSLPPMDSSIESAKTQEVETGVIEIPSFTGESEREGMSIEHDGMETEDLEAELEIQTVHQFFNHFFFPAFKHHQLVTASLKQEEEEQVEQEQIEQEQVEQEQVEKEAETHATPLEDQQ